MSEINLEEIEARAKAAHDHVCDIATGKTRWTMSIPARPDRDSDLLLSAAPADAEKLIAEVRRLELAHAVVTGALGKSGEYGRWAADEIDRLRGELAEIREAAVIPDSDMSDADRTWYVCQAYWRVRDVLDGPVSQDTPREESALQWLRSEGLADDLGMPQSEAEASAGMAHDGETRAAVTHSGECTCPDPSTIRGAGVTVRHSCPQHGTAAAGEGQ